MCVAQTLTWLIKIRTSIKPGNLTFGKVLLSDQIETTS